MYGTIKRIILSWIDVNRVILDYVEQIAEKGLEEPGADEGPLENLLTKLQENKNQLKEGLKDLARNSLHNGLDHLDGKLEELNERISALEKKSVSKPPPTAKRTTKARKSGTKTRKSTARRAIFETMDEEPIIDG
jgi:predicted nuclease with TOPRIM domain